VRFVQRTSNSSRKIQYLEQQLAEANMQLGELKTLRLENDFLRQAVASASVIPPSKMQRISCRIVSYSPSVIEVPRGGVLKVGAPVISNGALVGKIESVSGNQAVVRILSQSTGLMVIGQLRERQISGILQGENGTLFLTELPPENQPVAGEHVVTATQPDIPTGITIGLIRATGPEQVGSGVRAEVTPAASFFQAAFVEVWQ
jgi:cell shape-determining protein MreC